jgi:hypothetical protein
MSAEMAEMLLQLATKKKKGDEQKRRRQFRVFEVEARKDTEAFTDQIQRGLAGLRQKATEFEFISRTPLYRLSFDGTIAATKEKAVLPEALHTGVSI